MNDSNQFSQAQIRIIQLGLLMILLIGVMVLVFAWGGRQPNASHLGPAPASALLRLGKGTIEQLETSPDGRIIAVRTTLGVYIYRADDLEPLWVETQEELLQVGFSPDGNILWAISPEGLLGWDSGNGVRRFSLDQIFRPMGGNLWSQGPQTWALSWERGQPNTLAAPAPCGYQNELIPEPVTLMCVDFVDVDTGRLIEQLPTVVQLRSQQDPVPVANQTVSLHLGHNLATGEFFIAVQDRLWFWDPQRQLLSGVVPLPGSPSMAPVFSPDGTHALLWIRPTVFLLDRAETTIIALDPLPDSVLSLVYTLEGDRILMGTTGGEVYEMGPQTRQIIDRHNLGQSVVRMVRGQDLDSILLELGDGVLTRWRMSTGVTEAVIQGFGAPATDLAWSPAGDQWLTVSRPSTLERDDPRLLSLWQLDGERLQQRIFGERIVDVAWSADGETIAVGTLSAGGRVQWLDAGSLAIQNEYLLEADGLCGLALASDGRTAVATTDLRIYIFDERASDPVMSLNARDLWIPPGAACRGVVWSPDANQIALEIANGQPVFWDGTDGQPIDRLNPDPLDNQSSTVAIGWDQDGQPLIAGHDQQSGGSDLESRVSGIAQPTPLWIELPSAAYQVLLPDVPIDLAWAPGGGRLAVAYQDVVEIIEWNSDTGLTQRRLEGHRANILGLEWSLQGDTLASYSLDGSVIIWQIETGQ